MINTLTTVTPDVLAEIKAEQELRQTHEVFLLFAMGSQFDHLIKTALERAGIYCLVADPAQINAADVKKLGPKGILVSGGPASVHAEPPPFDDAIFDLGIPTLGICLGFQMWAKHVGAEVSLSPEREFGTHPFTATDPGLPLFTGMPKLSPVLQSHGDRISPSDKLEIMGTTDNSPVAAGRKDHLWGVQFHPEVTASKHGELLLENFCRNICGAKDRFPAQAVAARKIKEIQATVGQGRVLLALSGGSDSAIVAGLLEKALKPEQLRAVYIRGIDRPDDETFVTKYFGHLDLHIVDASVEFLQALAGHIDMRAKRMAMRGVYKAVLEEQAGKFDAQFISQGTIYTDISESGGGHTTGARKDEIRLHHNTNLGFTAKELTPLDDCVKDTARAIGRELGLAEELLVRQPFPGPGLVVRVQGEVTADRLAIVRKADGIFIEEQRRAGLYETLWQSGAVLTDSIHTYTKGDEAGSGFVLSLWAVWSVNGFTAEWAELPYDFLRLVSRRITNEIREVSAVVYRISDKPPATIEWG